MTTAVTFSLQNDAGSRARAILSIVLVLLLESKGLYCRILFTEIIFIRVALHYDWPRLFVESQIVTTIKIKRNSCSIPLLLELKLSKQTSSLQLWRTCKRLNSLKMSVLKCYSRGQWASHWKNKNIRSGNLFLRREDEDDRTRSLKTLVISSPGNSPCWGTCNTVFVNQTATAPSSLTIS